MPTNPKDIEFLLKDLATGHVSSEDIDKILAAAMAAKKIAQSTATKQTTRASLSELESHRSLLEDLMTEWWDDDKETAFVESLLVPAGAQVYGPEENDDEASAAISAIIDAAGSASNDRSELESTDDDSDDYFELEKSFDANYSQAMSLLEEFFKKFVNKAPTKKSTKKPAKKGK